MVERQSACLRRLAGCRRSGLVGFGRFLDNERVTVGRLIEGWGEGTALACAGRHVLAIQDTSEFNFRTSSDRRRGLGEIGKGSGRGLLLHAMLTADADSGGVLGLAAGEIWTRQGRAQVPHTDRPLSQKESKRWLTTSQAARVVLAGATMVTEVSDRESDLYALWAQPRPANHHLLIRAMHDRNIGEGGGQLSKAPLLEGGQVIVEVRQRQDRPARQARVILRFGKVTLTRPRLRAEPGLPETVEVTLVEAAEVDAPHGAEPILWRLLTTHLLPDAEAALRVVEWYRRRWLIEQFFRTLKQQGLQLEDSQLHTAERLIKLTAIAARAACVIMQLVQARDGRSAQPADLVFTPHEIETIHALVPELEGNTALQKNPHSPNSLAWAAWAIAKLGGWDGYPRSKPPGPITFRHGLEYFQALAHGRRLRDV